MAGLTFFFFFFFRVCLVVVAMIALLQRCHHAIYSSCSASFRRETSVIEACSYLLQLTRLLGHLVPCKGAAPFRSCEIQVNMLLLRIHYIEAATQQPRNRRAQEAAARWSPSSHPPSSTQMQNEAANEISRLEFVRLPIVTAARNASNSPMSKSMCHRIIELPTGTDTHTRRSRPQRFSGAVIFRIEGRLCARKARSSYACDLMEQARQNHAVCSRSHSHQSSGMVGNASQLSRHIGMDSIAHLVPTHTPHGTVAP